MRTYFETFEHYFILFSLQHIVELIVVISSLLYILTFQWCVQDTRMRASLFKELFVILKVFAGVNVYIIELECLRASGLILMIHLLFFLSIGNNVNNHGVRSEG